MGVSCSQPNTVAQPPIQEIMVFVDQINMVDTYSTTEMRMFKRNLAHNNSILRKRIAAYEEKLKEMDEANPVAKIYRAEKERAKELVKRLVHVQTALAYMK